jgi:O-methyltransferase involved in polyketide biosynthesis
LGDRAAAEAVARIDYDFERIHRSARPWANQFLVALRAKKLDVWTTDFLRRRPDAVVLHLGCGLDTRAFRVNPPSTVQWYDLDQPGVIELRRKLYDENNAYRMIGWSVTDRGWMDQIPTDRPTLVVAEREVRELLARLTARCGNGELLFDTLSPSARGCRSSLPRASSSGEFTTPAKSSTGVLGSDSSSRPPQWLATSRFRSRRSACCTG